MSMVKLTVRLPKLLHETLHRQAQQRNCSLNKIIVVARRRLASHNMSSCWPPFGKQD